MSGKLKFLGISDLIGPHAVRRAHDILYLNDLLPQSKGGEAKAAKREVKLKQRDEKIRADWQTLKAAGQKRHGAGKKLASKYGLSQYTINKVLRSK